MNSQNIHGHGGAAPYDRDRERDERHRAIHQHEEMARRDQERERERERERESGDRYPPGPHQSSAGSIPIHQPVASRISGAIHSPGGLLANHNGNPPPIALGAPAGPLANFGGPLRDEHGRPMQHGSQGNANAQHPVFSSMPHAQAPPNGSQPAPSASAVFGGPLQQQGQSQHQPEGQRGGQQGGPIVGVTPGGHQIPGGITQGQQPILNVSKKHFRRHLMFGERYCGLLPLAGR